MLEFVYFMTKVFRNIDKVIKLAVVLNRSSFLVSFENTIFDKEVVNNRDYNKNNNKREEYGSLLNNLKIMSKRKVQFSDDIDVQKCDENEDLLEEKEETKVGFGKKFKHTLDSDEEDDESIAQNYNVLDCDQIDGQERATIDRDGDIRITPFNMDEELEEGHFDKEGTYIPNKTDEIHDNWLDRIDWLQIKQTIDTKTDDSRETDDESEDKTNFDYISVYKEMLSLMQPKESVQKTIQRLGKSCGKIKSSDRWKNKNIDKNEANNSSSDKQISAKDQLLRLSSLADKVLQTGDMDIYQRTYEQLDFHLKKKSDNSSVECDMFSDDFDSTKTISSNNETISSSIKSSNDIKWEFKWQDNENAQVFGPYSSQEMLNWVNDGYFELYT